MGPQFFSLMVPLVVTIKAYPVYDRRVILTLTSGEIEAWRSEHQARVRKRRQAAAQAAAAGRKAKRQEEQMAHEG